MFKIKKLILGGLFCLSSVGIASFGSTINQSANKTVAASYITDFDEFRSCFGYGGNYILACDNKEKINEDNKINLYLIKRETERT